MLEYDRIDLSEGIDKKMSIYIKKIDAYASFIIF